jgi:hypothetical protein
MGRLGYLATGPINVLGSLLSDNYWARLAFVLMHFGVFVLFAAYVSRVLATKVTFPLLIILLTLQGIGQVMDHMPPIRYPLQNTLPLIMLFAARLTILEAESRGQTGGFTIVLARLAFLIALVLTEYTFLAGTAALACEYLARWGRRLHGNFRPVAAKVRALFDRSFLLDATIVVLAFTSYIGFRLIFPSSYPGNVIDAAESPWRIVETTIGHVHAATFFAHEHLFDIRERLNKYRWARRPSSRAPGQCLNEVLIGVVSDFGVERDQKARSGHTTPVGASDGGAPRTGWQVRRSRTGDEHSCRGRGNGP